ncbi:hypothetical protein B0H16DRAFT_1477234 [Mycena metata]|uniref:Uncharacterized protein n=1 Tax=Mycena metata TaxID=1033252 RepID=A0AAD7HA08_9AGAR|nr:hypothetical protein B0H16DRAFT_1477234 [Mycena metata]
MTILRREGLRGAEKGGKRRGERAHRECTAALNSYETEVDARAHGSRCKLHVHGDSNGSVLVIVTVAAATIMASVNTGQNPHHKYPIPLSPEVITPDSVSWIKPPPIFEVTGQGKWEKWVQYEDSTINPPTMYIRKRAARWKPTSKHSLWYDRSNRRQLYLRVDFQVPPGVVEVETFGCPAPRDFYCEWEQSEGGRQLRRRHASDWMYRDRLCSPLDANRVPTRPAADSLLLKKVTAAAPPVQPYYSDDEDEDEGGDYSDDEDPPPAVHMEPTEARMEVDCASCSPIGRALAEKERGGGLVAERGLEPAGLYSKIPTPAVSVALAREGAIEADGPDASKGDMVIDREQDEDTVSLGSESGGELTGLHSHSRILIMTPAVSVALAREGRMEADGSDSSKGHMVIGRERDEDMVSLGSESGDELTEETPPSRVFNVGSLADSVGASELRSSTTPGNIPPMEGTHRQKVLRALLVPCRAAHNLALALAPCPTAHTLVVDGPARAPHRAAHAQALHSAAHDLAPHRAAHDLGLGLAPRRAAEALIAGGPAPRLSLAPPVANLPRDPRHVANAPVRRNDADAPLCNAPARHNDVSGPRLGEKELVRPAAHPPPTVARRFIEAPTASTSSPTAPPPTSIVHAPAQHPNLPALVRPAPAPSPFSGPPNLLTLPRPAPGTSTLHALADGSFIRIPSLLRPSAAPPKKRRRQ